MTALINPVVDSFHTALPRVCGFLLGLLFVGNVYANDNFTGHQLSTSGSAVGLVNLIYVQPESDPFLGLSMLDAGYVLRAAWGEQDETAPWPAAASLGSPTAGFDRDLKRRIIKRLNWAASESGEPDGAAITLKAKLAIRHWLRDPAAQSRNHRLIEDADIQAALEKAFNYDFRPALAHQPISPAVPAGEF